MTSAANMRRLKQEVASPIDRVIVSAIGLLSVCVVLFRRNKQFSYWKIWRNDDFGRYGAFLTRNDVTILFIGSDLAVGNFRLFLTVQK